jgi:hypothetical protein
MKNTNMGYMMIMVSLLSGALVSCTDDPATGEPPEARPVLGEIATGQASPGKVVVDDDHVYWVNIGTGAKGSVMRLAKTGGDPQVLASDQAFPRGLVVDDTSVYWTAGVNGAGSVMKASKTGGIAVALVTGLNSPGELAGDDDHLYWTNRTAGIARVAKGGGTSQELVSSTAVSTGIAIDEKSVYFVDIAVGKLRSIGKAGGAITDIASVPQIDAQYMDTDGKNVFWHSGAVDSLWQVSATGGKPTVLFPGGYEMRYFVVTPDSVFIAQLGQPPGMSPGPGSIHSLDRELGTATPITPPAAGNWGVAVDERTVYWTNQSTGTVNAIER